MEMQIEIKPFVKKDGVKYKFIEITDISLHTNQQRQTQSVGKKIEQSFRNMEPGRIYSPIEQIEIQDGNSFALNLLAMDEDFKRMIQDEEAKGYKIILSLPKGGIPVLPGEDTVEFMKSIKGKRIQRRIAKQQNET